MSRLGAVCLIAGILSVGEALHAIITPLTSLDVQAALALARWPTTDAQREAFHDRYVSPIHARPVGFTILTQIEVITEFRRVEMIAEEHARLNDSFGRGGTDEVIDAIRPWRGTLTVSAHVDFLRTQYIVTVPALDVVINGVGRPVSVRSNGVYVDDALVGATIEAAYRSDAIGQMSHVVHVIVDGKELGSTSIDFGAIR